MAHLRITNAQKCTKIAACYVKGLSIICNACTQIDDPSLINGLMHFTECLDTSIGVTCFYAAW